MGVMDSPRKGARISREEQQLASLTDAVRELRSEISVLTRQRDLTKSLRDQETLVEKLKLEKDRLVEANDRKVRETEHQTGLLRRQVDQDQANAKKQADLAAQQAKLEVREENLTADKNRFAEEVKFQRDFMQAEIGRLENLIKAVLNRVPVVEVKAGGSVSARQGDDD
jgi:hypothetical protein